jgi:hypothetical protein
MNLQCLVYFIQHRVLEIIYYNTRVQSAIIKQRKKNKHLAKTIKGFVYAHQNNPPHELLLKLHPQQDKINPEYTMYSQDSPD